MRSKHKNAYAFLFMFSIHTVTICATDSSIIKSKMNSAIMTRINVKNVEDIGNDRIDLMWGKESRELAWQLLDKINKRSPNYISFVA